MMKYTLLHEYKNPISMYKFDGEKFYATEIVFEINCFKTQF